MQSGVILAEPFVTIIIPVYNVAEYLDQCLKSVIEQTLSRIEIILVDDGSKDRSGQICDEYAATDDRIRVIHQENQGLSVVRNVGIAAARSPYFMILDGDDWIEEDAVAILYKKMVETGCDICVSDYYVEKEGRGFPESFFSTEIMSFGSEDRFLLEANCLCFAEYGNRNATANLGVVWARMYRRAFVLDNGLEFVPGLKRMQDAIFNISALDCAQSVERVDALTWHYRLWTGSATRKHDPHFDETAFRILDEVDSFRQSRYPDGAFDVVYYSKCVRVLLDIVKAQYVSGDNTTGLLEVCRSVRQLMHEHPFDKAIELAEGKMVSKAQSIALFFLKLHWVTPIIVMYKIQRAIDGARR